MFKRSFSFLLLLASVGVVSAEPKDAFQTATATFEPAEAKPGQTVSLKIKITLGKGYHTYAAIQPSPAHRFNVNKFTFPSDAGVIPVGEIIDPIDPKSKKDDDGELLYYPGGGTWLKKFVVSPEAKPGMATEKIKVRLLICDENNCFPPKMLDLEATLKITEGSVTVDKAYAKEVEKALKK